MLGKYFLTSHINCELLLCYLHSMCAFFLKTYARIIKGLRDFFFFSCRLVMENENLVEFFFVLAAIAGCILISAFPFHAISLQCD